MKIMLVNRYILPGNRFSVKSSLFKKMLLNPESKLKICSVKINTDINRTRTARIFPVIFHRFFIDWLSNRNNETPDNKKQSAVLNLKLKMPGTPFLNSGEPEIHPIKTHVATAIITTLVILVVLLVMWVSFIKQLIM